MLIFGVGFFFPPNFRKMLITSFRLLYSRDVLTWAGILLLPAAVKSEVSCSTTIFFGTKRREQDTVCDFKGFHRKGFEPGHSHPLSTSGILLEHGDTS